VVVGTFAFRLLTPTNPDALLESLESPTVESRPHFADPYWAKLWPAAPRNPPAKGTRVLELGCGSGLVGITALALGLDVSFSDYVPLAVDLALENAARNGLTAAHGLVLDWRQREPVSDTRFEWMVAADVTYDRSNLDSLLEVVDERLQPGGQAWFGDAGRSPAPDFVERAKKRGWRVKCFDESNRAEADFVLGEFRRIVLSRS
jgi:predicted nicotinamide N-methyase